ncbi:MAG: type II toxin-antitoxin system HicA family toxin [Armatimonadota bacterium]|nr:type II toxin-antitoxin system HicA family toxin [Armatimonadota bacterium]
MTPVNVISPRKMVSIPRRLGFEFNRQKGSHAYHKHPDGRAVVVPMHSGEDLGKGLIGEILRSIELSVEDYEQLRRNA